MPRKNFASRGRFVSRAHSGGLPAPAAGAVVTPPSPTLRGSLRSIVAATSFAVTPSTTPVGEVMLHVGLTDGASITGPPAITGGGGGVTWTFLPPRGNEDANGASTRATFLFWGHGTFDGTAITCTPFDSGGNTDECTLHLIDWANASSTKPFTHVAFTTLLNGNSITIDQYQQKRVGSNNVLGGFVFDGVAAQSHTLSEGTVLQHDAAAGFVLSVTSFWHNTDFTNYVVSTSGFSSSSSGGHLYEVQASDSDGGPTANFAPVALGWSDASGNTTNPSAGGFTPKANQIVVWCAVTEKASSTASFTGVADGSANAYTEIGKVNPDANHTMHVWAFRYGASPPSATQITGTFTGTLIGTVGTMTGLLKEDGTALAGSTNTDWLAQAAITNTATAATSISATVPNIAQHSAVLAFIAKTDTVTPAADFVFEQGWIPATRPRDETFGKAFETECVLPIWLGGNEDSTPSATCAAAGNLAIIALEIA